MPALHLLIETAENNNLINIHVICKQVIVKNKQIFIIILLQTM